MAGGKADAVVRVDGHRIGLTNLDKVLYPAAGVTKGEVIAYYAAVSGVMIPHLTGRAVTRKRWPSGVDAPPFFEKNLGRGVPSWVHHYVQQHSERNVSYPVVGSPATLIWLAQLAALELHVPQWRFGERGHRENPDRMVFDLDPGPGTSLADCATVARAVREVLGEHGSDLAAVTSGSKGLHLYLGLNGTMTSEQASEWAHRLARTVERSMPELVISRMERALREGKVFIDWSQNNAAKTTVAPYSLRGRDHPTVAAPRTWEELDDPGLAQLDFRQVLERISEIGDPMAGVGAGPWREGAEPGISDEALDAVADAVHAVGVAAPDRLQVYRSKRSARRTPEPVPDRDAPLPHGDDDTFVIQEHHARRLHWDFRLERGGVLVSWAVPKGLPTDDTQNRLAVQTEDHPLEYAGFAGSIPKGEYGGGEVTIWDAGRYRTEKWRSGEIIVVLQGARARGRFVLVRTDDKNWLMRRMKDQSGTVDSAGAADQPGVLDGVLDGAMDGATPAQSRQLSRGGRSGAPLPRGIVPMLATPGDVAELGDGRWRLEGKWDGIRAVVEIEGGRWRAHSRSGNDLAVTYPELGELADDLSEHDVVLDGEIVAIGPGGAPSFALLQQRMGLTKPRDVRGAATAVPVRYLAFDLIYVDGVSLLDKAYDDRRRLLAALSIRTEHCEVPEQLTGSPAAALAESRRRKLEGIVAKRADSRYRPGRRSDSWIKVKHWAAQDVVVVGWRPGDGRRAGGIGSLLVAIPDASGELRYAGRVGTGFSDAMLDSLLDRLARLRRKTSAVADSVPDADARDAVWVTPKLVGEVTYAEITKDGRLRQPAWRGLRGDLPAEQVRREG